MHWQAIFSLIVVGLLFVSLMFERIPAHTSVTLCMLILLGAGVLPTKDALAGFSNAALITVAALFVVIGGVAKLPIMQKIALWAFGSSRMNQRFALFSQMFIISVLSAFLNNTPLVAFFMPIIKDWARSNGLAPSKFLIPLSYSAIMGG
jgi:Na+/H+ antiporter NhaD/arsenite permease-like protein